MVINDKYELLDIESALITNLQNYENSRNDKTIQEDIKLINKVRQELNIWRGENLK